MGTKEAMYGGWWTLRIEMLLGTAEQLGRAVMSSFDRLRHCPFDRQSSPVGTSMQVRFHSTVIHHHVPLGTRQCSPIVYVHVAANKHVQLVEYVKMKNKMSCVQIFLPEVLKNKTFFQKCSPRHPPRAQVSGGDRAQCYLNHARVYGREKEVAACFVALAL